jgi:uncharacterized protein
MNMNAAQCKCIYLHGFASGPGSTKALFFKARLEEMGIPTLVPDLNDGDFQGVTITRQLSILERSAGTCGGHPLLLVGSSLGGLLATLGCRSLPSVRAMILLAPAFGFTRRWAELVGTEGLARWEADGYINVYHHASKQDMRLGLSFIRDADSWSTDNLQVAVPTLVIHGREDEVVPVSESLSFKHNNPEFVELHVLEADHQLLQVLPQVWQAADSFLRRRLG